MLENWDGMVRVNDQVVVFGVRERCWAGRLVVPQLGKEGQFQVPGEIGVGLYTLGTMQGT